MGRRAWIVLPAIFALPALQPMDPVGLKILVVLAVGAVLPPKLIDLTVDSAGWAARSFGEWARYLLHPAVLVYRRHGLERRRGLSENLTLLAVSAAQMAAGAVLLAWSDRHSHSFWADHGIKLAAIYLMVFSGGIQLVTALCRLARSPVIDGSLHPVLAVTPADFWRRYNRVAGQFFFEDVYKPAGGLRAMTRGVFAVFFVNGLLHEYLATMVVGRVTGLQMAFFVLQGIAVAATARRRPRGAWIGVAWVFTLAFNAVTSVLFFLSFDAAVRWYDAPIR